MIKTLRRNIFFFVGPDMCGKTQIANAWAERHGLPYFKASSEHESFLKNRQSFLTQLQTADPRVLDLLTQTGYGVVFDRGYPCEKAYSSVYNRETDDAMLRFIDDGYASIGAVVVFCHRSSYRGIIDDLDASIDESMLQVIHNAYEVFLKTTKCDVVRLNVDSHDLELELREIERQLGD